MTLELLLLILVVEVIIIVVWMISREIGSPKTYTLQREVNLRLTYKRYTELYPSRITYQEYKRMQAAQAYKKAVSSMKIKRMVR